MSTFGIAGTSPFVDYNPQQVADLIYKYFGTNWSITSPTRINKASVFLTTNPADMKNRPDPGNRSLWLWVQHGLLQSGRDMPGAGLGSTGNIPVIQMFEVHMMLNTLPPDQPPEMGQMAGEIMRLTFQYHLAPVQGILSLHNFILLRGEEATAALGTAFSGYYKITAQIQAKYEKLSTV